AGGGARRWPAARLDRPGPGSAVHRRRAGLRAPRVAAAHVPALGCALERASAARLPERRFPRGATRRGEPLRGDGTVGVIRFADEGRETLGGGGPGGALETAAGAHGLPPG